MKRAAILLLLALAARADERTIVPAQIGPNRLDLDAGVLAEARRDLGDVRLIDSSGAEVPYLLIGPSTAEARWMSGGMLPVVATKSRSGFEVDLGAAHAIDELRVEGIAAPFLKRVQLEGSGDRAHWTLLGETTLFDLPDDKLRNLTIAFDAGDYRYLRVTWDDRSSAVVKHVGGVLARLHDSASPQPPMFVPLAFEHSFDEPQRTRFRVALPGPNLPIASIKVNVASGDVFRQANVSALRFENGRLEPIPIGTGTLRRAQRFGGVADDLEIPISAPGSVDLELVIDNDNNPPLAVTSIEAHLTPQPWIWFEAKAVLPLTIRYGDAQLTAPRYDIEASRDAITKTKSPPAARYSGAAHDSKRDAAASETLASFRGATIERSDYRFARAIRPTKRGMARLLLDADVVARSRQLADVRVVDASNRQVPYVVEQVAAPLIIPLAISPRVAEGSTSKYTLSLPYASLPAGTRLVIKTTARVFEREVTLRAAADDRRGRDAYVIASATWSGAQPDLVFEMTPRTRHVELLVDEQDNAPLPLQSASLQIPTAALHFYHSGMPLLLLYGNAQVAPPRYDLALLAPRVLSDAGMTVTLGGAPTAASESHLDVKIFWIALVVTTLALLAVLARLIASRATEAKP
jgi:hypothetical protein